jgi:hypothetical protein
MSDTDNHEVRHLKHQLRLANKTMGRQGATIYGLRNELARVREENSKLERGELRRLQRFEESALEGAVQMRERLNQAQEEIKRLREKLAAVPTAP